MPGRPRHYRGYFSDNAFFMVVLLFLRASRLFT